MSFNEDAYKHDLLLGPEIRGDMFIFDHVVE